MDNSNSNKIVIISKGTRILVIVCVLILSSLPFYSDVAIDYARAQSGDSTNNNGNIIMHFHPRLNVTVDGKPIPVPAEIGIEPPLWKYHDLDKYGMQSMNMTMGGMAPLHTHDNSGTIHVETSVNRNYTLGEFLDVWSELDINGKTVEATVNGQPISDWKNIILQDIEQINLG